MFSLARCRAILGDDSPESDADLSRLREHLYGMARMVVEACSGKRCEKRSPRAPNAPRRAFKTGAREIAPAGFSGDSALLLEDERYEVEERAAIQEFDGGLDRSAAERAAFSEYWRTKHNGGFK